MESNRKDLVQSVIRTSMIIEILSARGELGISEMSASLGLEKSTVSRLVRTLKHLGYLRQNPSNHKYAVSFKLLELGISELERLDIIKTARPFMEDLAGKTRETVSLGVLSGPYALYLDSIESPEPIKADQGIGQKVPLHASAIGKVLLAFQKEEKIHMILRDVPFIRLTENTLEGPESLMKELAVIKLQGYAHDNEESLRGLQCFAAPVMDFRKEAVAALSLAFPKYRYKNEEKRITELLSMLGEASRKLSIQLGADLERILS